MLNRIEQGCRRSARRTINQELQKNFFPLRIQSISAALLADLQHFHGNLPEQLQNPPISIRIKMRFAQFVHSLQHHAHLRLLFSFGDFGDGNAQYAFSMTIGSRFFFKPKPRILSRVCYIDRSLHQIRCGCDALSSQVCIFASGQIQGESLLSIVAITNTSPHDSTKVIHYPNFSVRTAQKRSDLRCKTLEGEKIILKMHNTLHCTENVW
mmetsp:Transcript_22302/g.35740  ORF Transcript_22302/g.35740 Transcript_22302/m.35740 type:complete len:210 (-) Transcript_22302:1209-1838(-)